MIATAFPESSRRFVH